ncbi:ABC transporter substrate-binding protein [Bradyrhizobium sp. URHD0069]|uniref:ABC transporter substrate-binding protein n=1 Tax=Bradyrhizobium sp. URHD0069 TaxID=1380355 RepID=UPI00055AAC18|nr:ABC transporter substrate-binding protein [Bradyrhizobium sp. URHD0069]
MRITRRWMVVALAAAILPSLAGYQAHAEDKRFTDWGWPVPYEKISDKSVAWLQQKGWWPVVFGWQGPFSGQNTINVVLSKTDLLKQRGLEAKFQAFAAGPDVNEAVAAGRAQVGNGGNFPFTSLIDRSIPVKALAVVAPNLKHSTVAPKDSKLKTLSDLKGSNPPATIGIVTGSSAEFYFTQAAEATGLVIGKDIILKNMPPSEQMTMAQGIAAVVPWEPTVTIMTEERKNGKEIDTIFAYNFYEGRFYVRQELIDNVPDVVQAISDAFIEASLWIRMYPEKAADFLAAEPMLKNYGRELLLQQIRFYNNLYKPTYSYPLARFWGEEDARIANWLKARNRITRSLTADDYAQSFDPRFMQKTYEKLGWAIPTKPSFIPANWPGKVGHLPYPPYPNVETLKQPQPWPEPGDLTREWTFAGKTYQP